MLHRDDRDMVARRFGADDAQVERDHLISHLLAGLASTARESVVFFGGTALSRTHLPTGRLSEDIDLYTTKGRGALAEQLTSDWPRAVRREFPQLVWNPALTEVRDVDPALLVAADAGSVRVQLVAADATYRLWPTELRLIDARYRDVGAVHLRVPTRRAFVAMKASAWRDRFTARDLFDLAELAALGAIDDASVRLLGEVTGTSLTRSDLASLPRDIGWREQLAHQCRLGTDADSALAAVRDAWAKAAGWVGPG